MSNGLTDHRWEALSHKRSSAQVLLAMRECRSNVGCSRQGLQIFFLLLFACIPFASHAAAHYPAAISSSIAEAYAAITPTRYKKGLFWKIEREGAAPSYLLGTLHVSDPAVTTPKPHVEKAFRLAKRVCTEVEMDSDGIQEQQKILFYQGSGDLADVLGPQWYQRTQQAVRDYSISDANLRRMKPWVVAYLLSSPPPDNLLLDEKLFVNAVEQKKRVCGLETPQEQLKAFTQLSETQQVRMLQQTIRELGQIRQTYHELYTAYLNEDLAKLVELSMQTPWDQGVDADTIRRFIQQLTVERNALIVKRMLPHLVDGNTFFAVGALHLPGTQGILQLLESEGYRISRVLPDVNAD